MTRALEWARGNWFYVALPFLLSASFSFRETVDWRVEPRMAEAATVFDWCVFVPLLYVLCYRGTMTTRAIGLRVLALACSGFWLAGVIVPDPAEGLLREWSWLRSVGLVALVAVEGVALLAVVRIALAPKPDVAELERQGVPPIIAKAMVLEARFWRWLWARLRGR